MYFFYFDFFFISPLTIYGYLKCQNFPHLRAENLGLTNIIYKIKIQL